ncbi:MAG: hypothetical protein IH621_04685 [Krumholzibacteria bacterium]|nr:hypothetical protein [Candidatus Krumholzibacteria bacterium]
MERERDSRLDRLAAKLRDEGVAPERDLWPEIDAAITRRERAGLGRKSLPWWRMAGAAAAVLILAVGIGTMLPGGGPEGPAPAGPEVVRMTTEPAETGGMATLDRALEQLEEALAADPDNLSLSRLVLMVHKTRSELLRRNLTTGLRVG